MQSNPPSVHISNGVGGLDKDTALNGAMRDGAPLYDGNNYYDALDISPTDSEGNNFGNFVIPGNTFATNAGSIEEQSKKYRVIPDLSVGSSWTYTLYDSDWSTVLDTGTSATIGTVADIVLYLDASLTAYDPTIIVTSGGGGNAFEIEWNRNGSGDEWFIAFTCIDAGGNYLDTRWYCIQDTFGPNDVGPLVCIGSTFINNMNYGIYTQKASGGALVIGITERASTVTPGFSYNFNNVITSKRCSVGWDNLCDVVGEINNGEVRLYWADGDNRDRVFVHNGVLTNGSSVFPNGEYDLDFANQQMQQHPYSTHTPITLVSQDNTGGNLRAGNKRYSVRYKTPFGAYTDWGALSNVVPCYIQSSAGDPNLLCGNTDEEFTPKVNNLQITNIDSNLFPKVQVACIEYTNVAAQAYIFGEFNTLNIPLNIQHTGNEVTQPLTITELNALAPNILDSLNIRILDDRLVKSNMSEYVSPDLSDYFQGLTLTTKITPIDSEGALIDTAGNGQYFKGYFDSVNIYNYAGYMDKETYRFGGRVKVRGGGYTKWYWIGDKTIDPTEDAANYATNGVSLTTTGSDPDILIRCVEVSGIVWADLATAMGIPLLDLEGVEFGRAECIPEVLATGVGTGVRELGVSGGVTYYSCFHDLGGIAAQTDIYTFFSPQLLLTGDSILLQPGDKFYYGGTFETVNTDVTNYISSSVTPSVLVQNNGFNNAPSTDYTEHSFETFQRMNPSVFTPSSAASRFSSPDRFLVTLLGTSSYMSPNWVQVYNVGVDYAYHTVYSNTYVMTESTYATFGGAYVAGTAPALEDPRYFVYFRPLTNKYGDIENTFYKSVNTFIPTNSSTSADLYGGDTTIERFNVKAGRVRDNAGGNYYGLGFSFYTQNRIHAQMRNGMSGGYKYPFQLPSGAWTTSVGEWLEQQADEGMLYTNGYTIRNNEQSYAPYDATTEGDGEYNARIRWSELKPNGSLVDFYLQFLPGNFKDLEAVNGPIYHHDIANGELITWQQRAFMRQYFTNTGLVPVNDEAVLVGDGAVMGRRGLELSDIGTTLKWSVIKGRTRNGVNVFCWWNADMGLMARFGYDGVVTISDDKRMMEWFKRYSTSLRSLTAKDWGSCVYGIFDIQNRGFYWSARAINPNIVEWQSGALYSPGQIVWYQPTTPISFDGIAGVYVALTSSLNLAPDLYPDNWAFQPLDDSRYYTWCTLAYSLNKDAFTSFYSFRPKLFMPFLDSYLTQSPQHYTNGSDMKIIASDIFCHNVLNPAIELYGAYGIWYAHNAVTVGTTTVDPADARLVSKTPIGDFNTAMAEFPGLGVVLYDNDNDFHPIRLYDSGAGDATLYKPMLSSISNDMAFACYGEPFIQYIHNQQPMVDKRPLAYKTYSIDEPYRVETENANQATYLTDYNSTGGSDFTLVGLNEYKGAVRNAVGLSGNNKSFADRMIGKWHKVKVMFHPSYRNGVYTLSELFNYVMRNFFP